MAEARKLVTRKVVTTSMVELNLTEDEAQFLTTVLASVGGDTNGPRRHQKSIYGTLTRLGFAHGDAPYFSGMRGSIIMPDAE